MSATIVASAAAVLIPLTTVMVAAMPEARDVLSPILEGGNEHMIVSISVLASLPLLAIMTVLAASGRD